LVDAWHDDLTALATLVIAIFTAILGVFTVRLAYSTKVAANAAKRSADAAVSVELPILILSYANFVAEQRTNWAPNIPLPNKFRAVLQFTNYGRSPAQITSGCFEWTITATAAELPLPPPYQRIFPYSANAVFLQNNRIPLDLPAKTMEIDLNDEQVVEINSARRFLWLYGFLAFKDFLGETHEARFCTKWAPFKEGENGPFGFVWDSETPDEYTKRT
jgi:hypothetical protein